jgi:hypothetical protein
MEQLVFREGEGDPRDQGRADLVVAEAGGCRWACDVRVTNPVTAAVELGHITSAGSAVRANEADKKRKYTARAMAAGYDFLPCIFSSQGEWGEAMKKWFGQLIFYQNRDYPSSVSSRVYWTRRIAVRLQAGISNAMMTRMRTSCYRGIDAGGDGGIYDMACQVERDADWAF